MKAVVFDLDQTLVDSLHLDPLRRARAWNEVYKRIPMVKPYPGITQLLRALRRHDIRIAVATSAPNTYCHRILVNLGWRVECTVCYHDTRLHKPHPEPILRALDLLGVDSSTTISVGDDQRDIVSSNLARVESIAALWGAQDVQSVLLANPSRICKSVDELKEALLADIGSHAR